MDTKPSDDVFREAAIAYAQHLIDYFGNNETFDPKKVATQKNQPVSSSEFWSGHANGILCVAKRLKEINEDAQEIERMRAWKG